MTPRLYDEAILRTLLYADVFDYPLTLDEIHHYLIATPATPEAVQTALDGSPWLAQRVTRVDGYVTVREREANCTVRDQRRKHSERMWPAARRWGYLIGCLPFVRMVAVTGALAVDNAPAGDDIDYLIVSAPGRAWLARALSVLLVRLARLRGVGLCPNYVLAQTALVQHQRDLYAAHDLAQMVPLVGRPVYEAMLAENAWRLAFLPHARRPLRREPELTPRGLLRLGQRCGEWLLGGRLGDALERWERARKLRKFAPAAQLPGSAAELDADHIKGHFDDNGRPIMARFQERLERFLQLEPAPREPHGA